MRHCQASHRSSTRGTTTADDDDVPNVSTFADGSACAALVFFLDLAELRAFAVLAPTVFAVAADPAAEVSPRARDGPADGTDGKPCAIRSSSVVVTDLISK